MLESTLPIDEERRLATLRLLNILDTPDEERFDRITRIVQRVLDVPIVLVSLLDGNRQWFKSRQGLDALETPRSISFCGHAIHSDEAFVIPDSTLDSRFADNPLVTGAPHIRFYAGHPLKANNGSRLGTLCVIDTKPRHLGQADLDLLHDLGVVVESELNLRDTLETRDAMLRDNAAIMSATINTAMDAVLQMDAEGNISGWNNQAETIFGWSRNEALGRKMHEMIIPPQYRQTHICGVKHFLATGEGPVLNKRIEISALHRDGREFPVELSITPLKIAGKYEFSAFLRDITVRKKAEQQLAHAAHYDALTNLPNRVLLGDRLGQAILQSHRRGETLAVAYLDLDGFKRINDKHGHGVGDELLVILSQRIKEVLREGDTLARIGGDEFVVVLVDLDDPADCEPVLARLLKAASQPVTVGDVVLDVSASIGVTLYPQDKVDADLLLRHADQAMYIAKESGKNRHHFFDVASASAVQTQRESLQSIAQALEQREFVLYYQPKVNMKTGTVVGAEALIRWQHPARGLLAPAAFLPIIEDHPLSVELGNWVIATGIAQMHAWHVQGMNLSVSVNIGARQLQQTDFAARLGELLAAHPDVKPHGLQLEVLETSALEDMVRVGAVMQACKEIGVGFALDDFGTGYSSLTYLKHLPAETLKIDQSFVRDMLTDSDDMAIVQGIIGLASVFRRSVIAEGVETHAHGALLLKLGCELAQGYGIARPMPAADFPAWVESWHAKAVWTA